MPTESGPFIPTPPDELNKCACCGAEIEWHENAAICALCGWEQLMLVMTDKESGERHCLVGPTPGDIADMRQMMRTK